MIPLSNGKSPAYPLLFAWYPEFVERFGRLPTNEETFTYLRDHHAMRPTTGTLKTAREAWLASDENQALLARARSALQGEPDPGVPSGSAEAAWLAGPLRLLRETIERDVEAKHSARANTAIAAAEQRATAAESRAAAALERLELATGDAARRIDAATAEATSRVDELRRAQTSAEERHAIQLAAAVSAANAEADARHTSAFKALEQRLADCHAALAVANESLASERAERARDAQRRDELAAEQYSGLSRVLGQQVADQKTRITELEKALLAERRRADGAEGSLVRQAVEQVTASLRTQADRAELAVVTVEALSTATMNEVRDIANAIKTVATVPARSAQRRTPTGALDTPTSAQRTQPNQESK